MDELIRAWQDELNNIKEMLILKGAESSTLEYNLLSCEALRLSECISELKSVKLGIYEADTPRF